MEDSLTSGNVEAALLESSNAATIIKTANGNDPENSVSYQCVYYDVKFNSRYPDFFKTFKNDIKLSDFLWL